MRIPLPKATMRADAKTHPYPFLIGIQTQEFLHASAFHAAFLDTAAGERVRQPNAIEDIRQYYLREGLEAEAWEVSWGLLEKYANVFASAVYQSVVVSLRSHWDWYVRRLVDFVVFCRRHITSPPMKPKDEKALLRVGKMEFNEQLGFLELATGLTLKPDKVTHEAIILMSHVRNLGLHNRWEVDQSHLDSHPTCALQLGDLRIVEIAELNAWADALRSVVASTCRTIGIKYVGAPAYP